MALSTSDLIAVADSLSRRALMELESAADSLQDADLREVARTLEQRAQRFVRIAAYLEARGDGAAHGAAVTKSNRIIARVRKALGYTYPKQDVSF